MPKMKMELLMESQETALASEFFIWGGMIEWLYGATQRPFLGSPLLQLSEIAKLALFSNNMPCGNAMIDASMEKSPTFPQSFG